MGQRAFGALDRRPIWAWAEQHVTLRGAYALTGPFRIAQSPYLRAVFEAITADSIRVAHLRAPVRSGKTLLLDVALNWIPVNAPGPVMVNFTTDQIARDHAKTRIWPNFRACPPVQELMPANRHDQNVQEIIFSNGMPMFIQGPAMANLQNKGVRWQFNDDIFDWEPGRLGQAMARVGDFEELGLSHILNLSQGGVEDDDEDIEFRKGRLLEWHVPCLRCGFFFAPSLLFNRTHADGHRFGFVFDDDEKNRDASGDWVIARVAGTAHFLCPACGHRHEDARQTRAEWNERGQYRSVEGVPFEAGAIAGDRLSFHLEACCTRSWARLLAEYLAALNALRRGAVEPFKLFAQKRRAVSWSETLLFSARPSRSYGLSAEDWQDEQVRFFTLDFQDDDVWWGVICAWGKSGQVRRLHFGRFISEEEILALQRQYKVKPAHVGIDCGYKTKRVYGMCVRHGWVALRGDHRPEFIRRMRGRQGAEISFRSSWQDYYGDPETSQGPEGRKLAIVIRWSNPTIKDRLQQILDRDLFTIPAVVEPERELEWKRQLAAEYKRRKRHPITGEMKMEWVCPSGNNHLRDALCEQVVLATVKRILPDIEAADGNAGPG